MSWHFLTKQLIIFAQELFLALYGENIKMRSIWPIFERHVVLIFMQYVYILLTHTGYIFECTHSVILFLWMNVCLTFILNKSEFILNTRKKMIYGSDKSYWYKETLLRFRPYRDILNGCGDFHFTFFFLIWSMKLWLFLYNTQCITLIWLEKINFLGCLIAKAKL